MKSCRFLLRLGLGAGLAFGAGGWAACTFLGGPIVSLFIRPDSPLFAPSVHAVRVYALAFPLMGLNVISAAFFTSVGQAGLSFPISVGRGLIFPVLAVLFIPRLAGPEGIWLAGAAAEAACFALTALFMAGYRRGAGQESRVAA